MRVLRVCLISQSRTYGKVQNSYDDLISLSESPNAIGFKIMYNHGILYFDQDFMTKISEAGIKIIHLIRRNKLLQYVSNAGNKIDLLLANKGPNTHQPHPSSREEAMRIRDEVSITESPEKILKKMRRKKNEDDHVTHSILSSLDSANYATIYYEDLCQNTKAQMSRLFNFLGVDDISVESSLVKIHQGKPTSFYFGERYRDTLKKAVEGSEFAWTLDGWE